MHGAVYTCYRADDQFRLLWTSQTHRLPPPMAGGHRGNSLIGLHNNINEVTIVLLSHSVDRTRSHINFKFNF